MTGRTRMRGDYTVTKALATVEIGDDDSADGPGTFSLILSTDSVDRDGEVVEKGAFEPLPEHISMDIDHGMSVATTVGSGRPFYNPSGDLQVDGTFASTDLGQSVRTLVREGHVRTASVAMIPTVKTKSKDNGPTRITRADLLNGAFTPVPSNRSATVLAAKSAFDAVEKAGRRNNASDQERVQSIHDMAAGLGAICGDGSSEGKHVHDTDTKTTDEDQVAPDGDADRELKSAADDAATKAASDAADQATDDDAYVTATAAALLKTAAGL